MIGSQLRAAGLAFTLCLLAACSRPAALAPPTGSAAPPTPDPWPQFAARFLEEYFRAEPKFAVEAGRHEFDGQMPDWSGEGIAAEVALLKRLRAEAAAFSDAQLTAPERFEREHLYTVIDSELFWRERARYPFTNPAWYIQKLDPDVYLTRDYAPPDKRLKGYIGYARAIPKVCAQIRANLKTPLPESFIKYGIAGFGGFASFYRHDVAAVFAGVKDPAAQAELAAADAAAAQAMDGLKSWLEGERAHATQAFALGEPLFLEMLRVTERVDLPVERLLEIGNADLERNLAALGHACAQYLPQGTLAACVAKMNADKPVGGAVAGARAQLQGLRAFVLEKQLVSFPPEAQALVAEAPPYMRANAAYINVPGPYEHGVASVYNIAPPDPAWSARERAAYIVGKASLLYTSVHEVWPGHFQQFLHSNANPSRIDALWVGYAYAEGWAHYSEEMMWDAGLGAGDPGQHVGQITNALLRDARYLSALGLHTRGMSVAQSERLFRERALYDPGNARQQAARGTYDPQYLDYTLGKLMIRKLRDDWIAQQPGAAANPDPKAYWHAFHDEFMKHTGPIPLIGVQMLGPKERALF
ncbi:MAG TPA: DUF885 domain-containing protein [Steroidobacteraceae bacterium]|nr:DUF885 domain-containing protein [Steroidobacteraceae bacterium]